MIQKRNLSIFVALLFILFAHSELLAESTLEEKFKNSKLNVLKKLKESSAEKGEDLRFAISLNAYRIAALYEEPEEIPDVVFNTFLMLEDISEEFYLYNSFLNLFIQSHLEHYNDGSNKKFIYYYLTLRSRIEKIQNRSKLVFANYDHIKNEEVLKEIDKTRKTIPLIIDELNHYRNLLIETFGSPCDQDNEAAEDIKNES